MTRDELVSMVKELDRRFIQLWDKVTYERPRALEDAERFQWIVDQKTHGAVYPRAGLKADFAFRFWCDDLRAKVDEARKHTTL